MENENPFKKGELLGPTPLFDEEINGKRKLGYSIFNVPFTLEEDPTLCANDEATIPVKVKIKNIYVKVVPLSVKYFRRYDATLAKAEEAAKRSKMETELPKPQTPPPAQPLRALASPPRIGDPPDELDQLIEGLQQMYELFKEKLGTIESYENVVKRLQKLEDQVRSFLDASSAEINSEMEAKVERILKLLESFQTPQNLEGYEVKLVPKVTSSP